MNIKFTNLTAYFSYSTDTVLNSFFINSTQYFFNNNNENNKFNGSLNILLKL